MTEKKDCGFLLKQINDRVEKNANNTLRAQDMTMSQLGALLELPLKEPLLPKRVLLLILNSLIS